MSVAHDLDDLAAQKRKEATLKLVSELAVRLYRFRLRTAEIESGNSDAWQEARNLANDVLRSAAPLELGLLAACAREVLEIAERKFDADTLHPDIVLYLLSALDTLGMELERLQHDRLLR